MPVYEDTPAVIASRAYEMAQTGAFENFEAIERELFAEGFGDEVRWIERPRLRDTLDMLCIVNRQSDGRRRTPEG